MCAEPAKPEPLHITTRATPFGMIFTERSIRLIRRDCTAACDGVTAQMEPERLIKVIALLLLGTSIAAIALSVLWRVPYILTFLGVAALVLVGHVVTIDDDMPGGWSNPDGSQPFPWGELLVKAAVVAVLALLALVPGIRALGR